MKNSNKILFIIFFATVIPTIYIYFTHAIEEEKAYEKSIAKEDNYKATKQLGEAVLFFMVGFGYFVVSGIIVVKPTWRIPYIILIVGTIAIVILYYMRIYGIPVLGTDVIIRDMSTDWSDVVTKICQQIMVVPLSILLARRKDL